MRYWEDFAVGDSVELGPYPVSEAELLDFSGRFDPQVFHTEPTHPRTYALGGLLASGWHTGAIFMRMAVDALLGDTAVLLSPGIDRLRWLAPVHPGDVLSGTMTVEDLRASRSKPDRGIMLSDVVVKNDAGVTVMTLQTTSFIATRPEVSEPQ